MKKELRKAIYTWSRLTNNFSKCSAKENEQKHKTQWNKYQNIRILKYQNFEFWVRDSWFPLYLTLYTDAMTK